LLQITTQQLEYLVAVADAPTWADAATALQVSPSALSQGLSQLERRIGVPLFDRQGRRRVLHPLASEVLAYARRVVAETRDLGRWAESANGGRAGQLRVGMIDIAAVALFGSTLHRFGRRRPDLDLHLAVAPSASLCQQLLAGELALAVVVEPPRNTGELQLTPLLEDELAVYGPRGLPTTQPEGWGPWVTFPASSHTRQLVAGRLAERGARFDVVAESHQPEVLREMVSLGMGWTVLPVLQAEAVPNPLQRAWPEPLMSRRLVVARRQGAFANPAAAALLDDLVAEAQRRPERPGPPATTRSSRPRS
jgi:DNA-binding transcriptional LysR family regulator